MSEFQSFLRRTLEPALGEVITNQLLIPAAIDGHFRRAFTHKTFMMKDFDYEVYEKVGDKVLGAAFQLWLVERLYPEITVPEPYAEIEKIFTGKEFLGKLTMNLGFDKWINKAEGLNVDEDMKEDVFEAFVGALTLAANQFIMEDLGLALAKRWIFQVYNTYAEDKIDGFNTWKYKDHRSRVNEVWQFNGWGTPIYRTTGEAKAVKEKHLQISASVSLIGPNIPGFPPKHRGMILGTSTGHNIAEAKEVASQIGLDTLSANYAELKGSEVVFDRLSTAKIKNLLEENPDLFQELINELDLKSLIFGNILIRKAKVGTKYVTQIRYELEGKWKNGARERGDDSTEAVVKVVKKFIQFIKNAKSIKL